MDPRLHWWASNIFFDWDTVVPTIVKVSVVGDEMKEFDSLPTLVYQTRGGYEWWNVVGERVRSPIHEANGIGMGTLTRRHLRASTSEVIKLSHQMTPLYIHFNV